MKVVKWGVHGTGTCIGPGILLLQSAESIFRYVEPLKKPTHILRLIHLYRKAIDMRGSCLSRSWGILSKEVMLG